MRVDLRHRRASRVEAVDGLGDARVEAVDELSDTQWDAALAATRSPFRFSHRSAAGRAFEHAFSSHTFRPCRVRYSDGVTALFPLVRVARHLRPLGMALGMPLGLEGTPLAVSGSLSSGHIRRLFEVLEEGLLQVNGGAGGSPPEIGESVVGTTHLLDTRRDFETVWRNSFTDKTRNMCRKAERAGVVAAQESNPEGAEAYYALYTEGSRRWGYSEPPYPRALVESFVGSGFAELWLARLDGRPVAGALLLRGSHDLLYWSGAMDRNHRSVAPSNAVVRAALESACQSQIDYFDFGASGELSGVESFKRSFGASPCSYGNSCLSSWSHRQLERALRHKAQLLSVAGGTR